MERGNRRLQLLITSAVSTSAITSGASSAWTTPVIPKIYNNEAGFLLTEVELSWVVAISSLGFMIGSLASRFTSDRFGRRATLLGSVLPIGIGVALKLLAQGAWLLGCARLLWGVGTGMMGTVTSIYLAEISDKDLRGSHILGNRFMFSFGSLLTMAIGPFVAYKTINYSLVLLPICYFTACWFIPETPYFLLKQGKVDAARHTLMKLTNIKDEEVLEEKLSQMRSDVRKEMTRSGTLKEFLTGKQYRRAIVIVVGLKITQLMAGLHAIQQYLGPIIQESNFSVTMSTALIIFGVVKFAVGILAALLVDRLGRRPLLIYSYLGSGIFLSIVGAYFIINVHHGTLSSYNFIPFVGIILAIIIAVLGFVSVSYMIPAELFPINVKSVAMATVNIFSGLLNFISVKSYQPIKDLGGLSTVFCVSASATLAGAVFSYFFVPETKCKSLRQIQIELQGNVYDENSEKLQSVIVNDGKYEDVGERCELNGTKKINEAGSN